MSVLLETSLGDLTIDLDATLAPKAAQNFLKLCQLKYLNDQCFYKLQKGFLIECGDATLPQGIGPASMATTAAAAPGAPAAPARLPASRGGDSVWGLLYGAQARCFPREPTKALTHARRGTVTMLPVAGSKALHASCFAITLSDGLQYLDESCAPFGRVVEGLDEFIARLAPILTDEHTHQPRQNIRIRHTIVLEDPFPDPPGLADLVPPSSPAPLLHPFDVEVLAEEEALEAARAASMSAEELAAEREAAEARSRAAVLEMLGDLPSMDAEPPPNVLFVCKLHPSTRSDDLELIFSRFGELCSCDVIRDPKTDASLQYAFIEFATPEACEQAYFKMNNVLIDERRIKVDFSQSVAKQWNQYRRQKINRGRAATTATTTTTTTTAAAPAGAATPQAQPLRYAAPVPAAAALPPPPPPAPPAASVAAAAAAPVAPVSQPPPVVAAVPASAASAAALAAHTFAAAASSSSSRRSRSRSRTRSPRRSSSRRSRSADRDRDRDRDRRPDEARSDRSRDRDRDRDRDSHRSSSRRSRSPRRSRDGDRSDRHSSRRERSRSPRSSHSSSHRRERERSSERRR